MRAEDLSALEPFLGTLLGQLQPGERRRMAIKLGRLLRRNNAQRMARNVEPDGSPMEPRKPRTASGRARRTERRRGRVRGKMFRNIRKIQALRIQASPDGVELGFANALVEKTAAAHHFGLVDYVGRKADGTVIRTRYPARRLLGFGPDDLAQLEDLLLDHLAGG